MVRRGKLIAIEGTDGSGKKTQVDELRKPAFKRGGFLFDVFDFPRYNTPAGRTIRKYLDGYFGDPVSLDPRLSSVLYAEDRRAASSLITDSIELGRNVLCNRYMESNLAHQGAKLTGKEQEDFVEWCEDYEFNVLKIPKPDIVVCLHVPYEETLRAMENQSRRKDGHEANLDYQQRVVETYLWLASTKPGWKLIECMDRTRRKSIEEVAEEIWSAVFPVLTQ